MVWIEPECLAEARFRSFVVTQVAEGTTQVVVRIGAVRVESHRGLERGNRLGHSALLRSAIPRIE